MRNFLRLSDFENKEVMNLINDSLKFKSFFDNSSQLKGNLSSFELKKYLDNFKGKLICNLFFEPSTRTQYSFITAEEKLNMKVMNFNPASSSLLKGETFYDTIKTFDSYGLDAMVIRDKKDRWYDELINGGMKTCLINAGDGTTSHPSQNLLDLVTIYENFGKFEGLKIAFIGDIKHSRVVHGNIEVMKKLGMHCYIAGPEEYLDNSAEHIKFEKAIEEMDILMLLRIQYERHNESEKDDKDLNQSIDKMLLQNGKSFDINEYSKNFGINKNHINKMKNNAIIMHPAPFNRGVELDSEIVECPKSRIFEQMKNGVYARMAILNYCFNE